jgi:hypothetical protein
MEQFFGEIGKKVPGYEEFEKEGWNFKVSYASVILIVHVIMGLNSMIV